MAGGPPPMSACWDGEERRDGDSPATPAAPTSTYPSPLARTTRGKASLDRRACWCWTARCSPRGAPSAAAMGDREDRHGERHGDVALHLSPGAAESFVDRHPAGDGVLPGAARRAGHPGCPRRLGGDQAKEVIQAEICGRRGGGRAGKNDRYPASVLTDFRPSRTGGNPEVVLSAT